MENRHQICIVVTDAISFNVLCRGQLEYFKSKGAHLSLICGGASEQIIKLSERNVGQVVKIPFARQPRPLKDLTCLLQLVWVLIRLRPNSIIYSTPKASLLAAVASWALRIPHRVFLVRGRAYENFTGLKRSVYILFDRVAIFFSHDVVVISKSLAESMTKDGLLRLDQAIVVHNGSSNGVDVKYFNPDNFERENVRMQLGLRSEFVFTVLGRVCEEKGVRDALEAFRTFKDQHNEIGDARLIFVGYPEDQILCEEIKGLNSEGITFLGPTESPAMILSATDVLLFLSHREGFGNVAIEASAMQVPVIGYDIPGVQDSIKESISGLLAPKYDTQTVAKLMFSLYADSENARTSIRLRSREYAINNFNQELIWHGYLDVFMNQRN